MGRAPVADPSICFNIVLRYILHLARPERMLMLINIKIAVPHCGGQYSYHRKVKQLVCGIRAANSNFALTALRVFRQTVWHHVKSGRAKLFMYDRESIKA
jgi:hypothetical protein